MKRTFFKIFGGFFIAFAIVLTQIPVLGTRASNEAYNGFMMDGTKLVKYTGTASAVSVPNGVKVIGSEAFNGNVSLSSITLPSDVKEIENGAFSGCINLRGINIPNSCETIGNGAFADCEKLESVQIPASLISLGTSAFAGCDSLKGISIAKGNNYYICEDGVIYSAKRDVVYQVLAGRESNIYAMPNSVEEIKKYAFWGCSNLNNVAVSSNLKEVSDYSFSNATGLENITLPYSVRAIRRKAFEDCLNLKEIVIPVSVTEIDNTAFDGCYNVIITAEPGSVGEKFKEAYDASKAMNEEYEDSVSQNGTNRHWKEDGSDESQSKISIPYASDVDHYVEWDVESPGVMGRTKIVSGQAVVLYENSDVSVYGGDVTNQTDKSVSVNAVPDSVVVKGNEIGYKAFYCDNSMQYVEIPQSVQVIGDFAFARTGLKQVRIPSGVTQIGTAAFYHCDGLKDVYIPKSVTEIGEDAFSNTEWLNNWKNNQSDLDDFLIVGDGILIAYKGYHSQVVIPNGVKQIGAAAFINHDEISQVTIPDTVRIIGEDSFFDCNNLTTVVGMNGVEQIRDNAFYNCPIATIRIPASVKKIGVSAFGGTDKINCVIFLGKQLPEFSYEKSSTRLSAKRNNVFDDISVAIVPDSVNIHDIEGSILDASYPGFSGIIYHISNTDKKAEPIIANMTENDVVLPDSITVYENKYSVVQNVLKDFAKSDHTVSDNSLQSLMVVDHSNIQKKEVTINSSGSTSNLSGYHFYLSDAGLGTADLKDAVEKYYGNLNDSNSFIFDISLYDPTDNIPMSQLGKSALTLTIPVPTNLIGKELCIVTIDRNNNPEVLFGELSVKDNRQYISFDITHFSPYAIYAPDGELKDKITQKWSNESGLEGLDDTPNTGDFVPVKLILCIGLLSLGSLFLILGFSNKFIRREE